MEQLSTFLERAHKLVNSPSFGDILETSEDIAMQSRQTSACKISRPAIINFANFQRVTLKPGSFVNFKMLFANKNLLKGSFNGMRKSL